LIAQAIKHQKKQAHEKTIEDAAAPKQIESAPKPAEKKASIQKAAQVMPSQPSKPAAD
jgi:hypothetical protein